MIKKIPNIGFISAPACHDAEALVVTGAGMRTMDILEAMKDLKNV